MKYQIFIGTSSGVAMDNWKVHLLVLSAVAGICCSVFFQHSMRVREIFFLASEQARKRLGCMAHI
jgi:hypothetical protein